jgi:hypothetical protein
MNAQATLSRFAASVESLHRADSWQAWKLGEQQSHPIALDRPNGLQAAIDQAVVGACWNRGDTLAVTHQHAGRAETTLWLHTIKQEAKPVYRRDPVTGAAVRSQRLYPVLVSQVALAAPFAPVEAFDAFRDDPVGVDRTVVDASFRTEWEQQA